MDLLRVADNSWPLLNRVFSGHAFLYRASGGRVGRKLPGLPPFLLLEHVGAKSGQRRTSPLLYLEDGGDLVVIASKGGYGHHPAWFHNLVANPETAVQVGTEKRQVRARVATPEERKRLWPRAVAMYSGYAGYQDRTDREIPLVVLEPREP